MQHLVKDIRVAFPWLSRLQTFNPYNVQHVRAVVTNYSAGSLYRFAAQSSLFDI